MPSRNLEKMYLDETYYHIYNRGVNKRRIFIDNEDYTVFLNLLKRYLSNTPIKDNKGREYTSLFDRIELLSFCLMPNHYHILIYQKDSLAITSLLRSVATSYTMYFNKKYKRVGPLFQDRYKASLVSNDAYLMHISRYIHLNHKDYKNWEFSSYPYYLREKNASWVRPDRILELFSNTQEYIDFSDDYIEYKEMLDQIKSELASE